MEKSTEKLSSRCSPSTVLGGGITAGFGWIILWASILVIIMVSLLKTFEIFIINDLWFIVLFVILGLGVVIVTIGFGISAHCIQNVVEEMEETKSGED